MFPEPWHNSDTLQTEERGIKTKSQTPTQILWRFLQSKKTLSEGSPQTTLDLLRDTQKQLLSSCAWPHTLLIQSLTCRCNFLALPHHLVTLLTPGWWLPLPTATVLPCSCLQPVRPGPPSPVRGLSCLPPHPAKLLAPFSLQNNLPLQLFQEILTTCTGILAQSPTLFPRHQLMLAVQLSRLSNAFSSLSLFPASLNSDVKSLTSAST